MALNVEELAKEMFTAFTQVLGQQAPGISEYAKGEAQKLAQCLHTITRLREDGKISEKKAQHYLQMQKDTTKIVLLTLQGLATLAVENAINAALNVIKDRVNAAVGFALL